MRVGEPYVAAVLDASASFSVLARVTFFWALGAVCFRVSVSLLHRLADLVGRPQGCRWASVIISCV